MKNLVWLFPEHRDAVRRLMETEAALDVLSAKFIRVEEDNRKLGDAVEKLQTYVSQTASQSPLDVFEQYQKQVLQDEPYADGKIPDSEWLTPGEPIREENVND